jgi:hypothetical protein
MKPEIQKANSSALTGSLNPNLLLGSLEGNNARHYTIHIYNIENCPVVASNNFSKKIKWQ